MQTDFEGQKFCCFRNKFSSEIFIHFDLFDLLIGEQDKFETDSWLH